jgi:hypothetical protein
MIAGSADGRASLSVRTLDRNLVSGSTVPVEEEPFSCQSGDVYEVSLLLSAGQICALEEAAHDRGLTAAEMFRRVLQDFIAAPTTRASLL